MRTTLLFLAVILFTACETGTRYEKNATIQSTESRDRGDVNREIDALLNDHDEALDESINSVTFEEREPHAEYIERDSCRSSVTSDGLEVKNLRVGYHNGYTRLVFDIYHGDSSSNVVGRYKTHYDRDRGFIVVLLEGYKSVTSRFPTFSRDSIIEKVYFDKESNGYKFYIKLRKEAEVNIFDLKNPARLVFDIKAI